MRKHQYIEKVPPSYQQLLFAAVDAWTEYSQQKAPIVTFETKYVDWKCFRCSHPIKVRFNTTKIKDMYCTRCRPHAIHHLNALQVRYFSAFKEHIRFTIEKNSGI